MIKTPAYKDTERNTWYVKFRCKDWSGKARYITKRGFRIKKDALAYEQSYKSEKSGAPDILFKDFLTIYYEDRQKRTRETSLITKKSIIDTHVLPFFSDRKLTEITPALIRQWQNTIIDKDYSPPYARAINTAMRSLFHFAAKYFDSVNPAQNSDPIGKKKPKDEMQFWTKEEFDAVIYAMTSKHYVVEVALKMLFGTGMRSGELLALTHNDIDFENKTISITKTHTRINGEDNIFPPKTPRSRRIIPISDTLVEILQDYINRLYDYDPEDRIFPFTKEALRYCMEKYSKKPGIKLIRLHDLRHSHASLLIDMGADVLLISQRLGHENMQTTLNRYSHLYPNKQAQLAVSLDVLMKEANQDMGSKRGAR